MKHEDFYTGEPTMGSPPISPEAEAANMASFGKYDYDPRYRQQTVSMQPTTIYPGNYGYNTNMNPGYYPTVQQQQPVYSSPYAGYQQYQGGYGYQQQPQQYGLGANPAFQYAVQPQYYQPVQAQPVTYTVPGYSPTGSEYLPPIGYEDTIEKMKTEYWYESEIESAKQEVDNEGRYQYNLGYGYNFYGMPYYNPYSYNSVVQNKYRQKLQEMEEQAREARRQFNLNLCELAYNYCNETYDEEELKRRLDGYTVELPGVTNIDLYNQNRLDNLVPFDNSQMYRDYDARVSAEHNQYIPKDATMEETFADFGLLGAHYAMQEEEHRRRNGKLYYNSSNDGYKNFIHRKAKERYMREKGIIPTENNTQNAQPMPSNGSIDKAQDLLNNFPTLKQSAYLSEDGTLNITCNFGKHQGETYSVHNSQEAEYDKKRERFNAFINSIPGAIYKSQTGGGGSG